MPKYLLFKRIICISSVGGSTVAFRAIQAGTVTVATVRSHVQHGCPGPNPYVRFRSRPKASRSASHQRASRRL